ncbi:MAG: hypothetical protein M3Q76_09990 [Acidobacteriota bacterium]|nr:hypothetical protein [Acidobacteriota bacterium]
MIEGVGERRQPAGVAAAVSRWSALDDAASVISCREGGRERKIANIYQRRTPEVEPARRFSPKLIT